MYLWLLRAGKIVVCPLLRVPYYAGPLLRWSPITLPTQVKAARATEETANSITPVARARY